MSVALSPTCQKKNEMVIDDGHSAEILKWHTLCTFNVVPLDQGLKEYQ